MKSFSSESETSINLDSIHTACADSGYAKHLGLKVIKVSEGTAKISMELKAELANPSGAPHGGAILSLADHTCGTAAMTLGPCVGGQFSVNFIASPNMGENIVAEAKVIHNGRRTRIIEVEVKEGEGRLVAEGTAVGVVLT